MDVIRELAKNGDYLPDSWLEEYIDYRLNHPKLSFADKLLVSTILLIILEILFFLSLSPV